ncbi:hypothetical protein [Deinococcus arenicola]|uniref:NlpC/P60 domain-containing protein n=1 Tax=Deinococcus arenicola TaxID=2994950 RepID=A0ABU4DVA3_9DEIO|nr:hypothetical protein [Deinococcus sp. ZS9-10]MDV6376365.1 hypothetical protein [Deinococcus sp. ZS9-10]
MSSPMRAGPLHDAFTLLDGTKRWVLPGAARVTVSISAANDVMSVPGDDDEVAQVQEAGGEVKVQLTMWEHEQWTQYQHVLTRLRRGTKDGAAVFTCAHPEVRARRIRQLYFVSEEGTPYSPKDGYRVTLSFSEKVKAKQAVSNANGDDLSFLTGYDTFSGGGGGPVAAAASSAEGQALLDAALKNTVGKPRPLGNGRDNDWPGMCSAWTRQSWQDTHGGDRKLFGESAVATERNFKTAGQYLPWTLAAQQSLSAGDLVFYGATKSNPYGHVGISDGKGGVLGNNFVTYAQRGGVFDSTGKPTGYDRAGKKVDARGLVPIGQLGTPSGIGKPSKVAAGPRLQGPAAPLPQNRPSTQIPGPRN